MSEEIDPEKARLLRAAKRYDKVVGESCKFERGVKLITKERRLDRAMPWFRRFIRSREGTEKQADGTIAYYRAKGFGPAQVGILRSAFLVWKRKEKSRKASINRAKRKKKAG